MEQKQNDPIQFSSLMNVLRTFACLSIVEGHYIYYIKNIDYEANVNGLENMFVKQLLGMVLSFFILSGFGLTFSYYKHGIPDYTAWYKKRLKKVIPPYWIVVTFFFLVLKELDGLNPGESFAYGYFDLTMYLLLLRNFVRHSWFMFEHLWFIPVIISLYVVFPLLIRLYEKSGTVVFLILSIVISYAAIGTSVAFGHNISRQSSNLLFFLPLFSFGMVLGHSAFHDQSLINVLVKPYTFFIGAAAILLSAIMRLSVLNNYNDMFTGIGSFLMLTVLLYWVRRVAPDKAFNLFSAMSEHSYLVYLIHLPVVIYFFSPLFSTYHLSMNTFVLIPLGLVYCALMFFTAKVLTDMKKASALFFARFYS